MQLILYGISNCNSVKKARAYLDQQPISYTFYDYKKQGISQALLLNWLDQVSYEKLINRSGLTWRGLDDATKLGLQDNISAIALMCCKTSVIKRPILEKNGKIISIGFDAALYSSLCQQSL